MFGVVFDGHPHLTRILLPKYWEGHPLRKEYHARATEFTPHFLNTAKQEFEQENLRFVPEEWGMKRSGRDEDFMFLNIGQTTHLLMGRFVWCCSLMVRRLWIVSLTLAIITVGRRKMAERQTWHSFIPYTDRIDYLGGVMNERLYIMAVEKLVGISTPGACQCQSAS